MVSHEINVSELIGGNAFISYEDGLKLFKEIDRLLGLNDLVKVDFLGIEKMSLEAIYSSIGRLFSDGLWDKDLLKSNIKYINVTDTERYMINSCIQ